MHEGQFASTALAGTRFAWVISFPGAVHEGNGTRLTVVDEGATDEQREALATAAGGKDNGPPGVRAHYHENYYAAFVHDADGNNVEAVCQKPQ